MLELPMLLVREQPQRRYPENGVLAHVLGYVGEIGPEQLKQAKFKEYTENPYHSGDIIGQEGLESSYDRFLRGKDGYRKVEVDSRGRIQRELEVVQPQPGQDLLTTIDLDFQLSRRGAASQLAQQARRHRRDGSAAMASFLRWLLTRPSTRTFSRSASRRPKAARKRNLLLKDPLTPLFNRAIRGRYPPGSTWKIPMAVAGLQQGAITLKNSHLVCGGGIQVGNKFTRCMGNHGSPELHTAIRIPVTAILPSRLKDGH